MLLNNGSKMLIILQMNIYEPFSFRSLSGSMSSKKTMAKGMIKFSG